VRDSGMPGEVVVADNGSTDGSREIAAKLGARVVPVPERGYGAALMGGIAAAEGEFVIMGDADDSYDFLETPKFAKALDEGNELVMGCRLPGGGGKIAPGAMPFLHRFWGNPMFSWMARRMFGYPGHDVYCGLRGFRKSMYERLNQRCTGMEFAVEMLIRASLSGVKFAEVPITLHQDGRRLARPHLRTFRDGWRTLRLFLLFSPRWLYVLPALLFLAVGLLGYALGLPRVTISGAQFDLHTLLVASLSLIVGTQLLTFGAATRVYASEEGFLPRHAGLENWLTRLTVERVLGVAGGAIALGVAVIGWLLWVWASHDFGALDYPYTMRRLIPAVTLIALAVQAVFAAFFLHLILMPRRR
jgi:glycosyltransferase involved in cell wall biosynthesis